MSAIGREGTSGLKLCVHDELDDPLIGVGVEAPSNSSIHFMACNFGVDHCKKGFAVAAESLEVSQWSHFVVALNAHLSDIAVDVVDFKINVLAQRLTARVRASPRVEIDRVVPFR